MFSARALSSLLPASAPAITISVFLETLLVTFAPCDCKTLVSSSRVKFANAPVKTIVLFVNGEVIFSCCGLLILTPNSNNLLIFSILSGSKKYSTMLVATISPTSSILIKSSTFADFNSSMVLYFLLKTNAVFFPIFIIPSAKIKFDQSIFLLFSMLEIRLFIFLSLNPSSPTNISAVKLNNSYGYAMLNFSYNSFNVFSLRPSILNASRETKCVSLSTICSKQPLWFKQNKFAPIVVSGWPQLGQNEGGTMSILSCASSATPITSGMTSLLRLTKTVLFMLTRFLSISCVLFNVALLTVAPDSSIGSSIAIGVIFPVLPTCHITSSNFVDNSTGLNLYAIAHFGNLIV